MADDWKQTKLSDVIIFNPSEKLCKGTEAKKISMEQLKPYNRKIDAFEEAPYNGGSKFRNEDTLFARITPCLENGKTAQVKILDKDEVGFGSTEFIVLREKSGVTDNNFIYYLSISPEFRNKAIQSMTGTSGRQRVQTAALLNYEMLLPPLPEQKEIAATLSALDDKIELNNQTNKKLEEMAQAIYKSWFIDFEPFKDGEFEDSELGMIPKGWKVGNVSEFGEVVGGSTPSKKEDCYFAMRGIPWITPKDLSLNHNKYISRGKIDITEKGFKNSSTRLCPKASVLFSSRAPIGYIAIAKNDVTTNQGFKSIIPFEKIGSEYVYYFLKTNIEMIENRASGSTFKEISGAQMKQVPALIPDNNALYEFNDIANCIGRHIEKFEEENNILIKIRDDILPKLMSGEIRVPAEG